MTKFYRILDVQETPITRANNGFNVEVIGKCYVAYGRLEGYKNLDGDEILEGPCSRTKEEAIELLEKEMEFRYQNDMPKRRKR